VTAYLLERISAPLSARRARNDQPAALRIPGLDPRRRYQVTEVTPGARGPRRSGLAIAPQRTLTAVVVLIEAV